MDGPTDAFEGRRMTCQEAEPLLARAADGMLDPDRAAALAPHLHACSDCREALDAQRAVRTLLVARPAAPVPADLRARILAGLPERRAGSVAGWIDVLNWRAWTLRLAPVAAALFVGAGLGMGASTDPSDAGAADYAVVLTAWVADETAAGPPDAGAEIDTVARLWRDERTTDDLLLDVLLAADGRAARAGGDEAGR